jgi:hypothetical protein
MAMDKGLYAAPLGMEQEMDAPIEIEIEDPESVSIGMGDIEIDLEPRKQSKGKDFDANLADEMDDADLDLLGSELVSDFEKDVMDRKDWIKTYVDGLKLLGLQYEDRTEPWQGACGVFHPMLTESVVRFKQRGLWRHSQQWVQLKQKLLVKRHAIQKKPLYVYKMI